MSPIEGFTWPRIAFSGAGLLKGNTNVRVFAQMYQYPVSLYCRLNGGVMLFLPDDGMAGRLFGHDVLALYLQW
jgi:hypothetical protein